MRKNFDEKNQEEIAKFVLDNLPRHKQFALGTIDENGSPWVVCLNLAYDDKLNIIWKSKKDTEHSKHIATNKNVSICVYSNDEKVGDFGFYTKVVAHEVSDEKELEKCLDFRYKRKNKEIPPLSELLGDSDARIYIAEIREAWVSDNRHLKTKVDMKVLRSILN